MSRNLTRDDCHFCQGSIVLEETPRPIRPEDCGVYFPEYTGMLVANAHCYQCEAKYLAWIDGTKRAMYRGYPRPATPPGDSNPVRDLSFRSTFNDEPGPADYPRRERSGE